MNNSKLLKLMFGLLIIISLTGCSGVIFGPTVTPTPIPPTETPTPVPGPKSGHWEGEPYVSFNITTDGNIHDFRAVIPFQPSTCTITLEEIKVEIDGAFIFPDSVEKPQNPDEKIKEDHIYGKFIDTTTIAGTYKFGLCGNNFVMPASEDTWNAKWKGP